MTEAIPQSEVDRLIAARGHALIAVSIRAGTSVENVSPAQVIEMATDWAKWVKDGTNPYGS